MNANAPNSPTAPTMLLASTASPGLARGRALHCACALSAAVSRRQIKAEEATGELARFDAAIDAVEQDLTRLQENVRASIGSAEAEIFGAQILMLHAIELREAVLNFCIKERINIEAAVEQAVQQLEAAFNKMKDPYLRERGADLREVGKRLVSALSEADGSAFPSDADGCVLVSRDAATAVVAQLKGRGIRGLILESGGLTTHAAIIARAIGIPMLVEATDATRRIATGDRVILDAIAGRVFVNPDASISIRYDQLDEAIQAHEGILKEQTSLPCITLDGTDIGLAANIGQTADAVAATQVNANGAGLYRTEFVFQAQDHFPPEDEQYRFYQATAKQLAPNPTVIRLLDVGSDKPLPYFPIPAEANPALGRRGLRLLLERPAVLRDQLRAILRLSAIEPVSILVPMVTGLDDIRALQNELKRLRKELAAERIPFDSNIAIGAMIETPSAALLAREIADETDFLSVGSNDLAQYLLCADRAGNTTAYDPIHPAVIRTLASLAHIAKSAGKPISLCGEMAGDPLYTALLLGIGYRRLSVAPERLLEVKYAIRSIRLVEAERLARRALALSSSAQIRALVHEEWTARRPVSSPDVTTDIE